MPWKVCDVTQAGAAENGVIYIALRATDGSFHNWFIAYSQMEKEMLATALTAISTSKRVNTYLTGTSGFNTISRMYVMA